MGFVISLISFLLIALMPFNSEANCLSWVLCPYIDVSTPDAPSIKLSIAGSTFPADTTWTEIVVRGQTPSDMWRGLVCVESTATKEAVDAVATAGGCTVLNRGQVTSLLVKPKQIFWDTTTQSISMMDGRGGRPDQDRGIGIPRNIDDDLVRGR